ncbi:MAG TPA: hypothetical protein VJS92_14535 [Candidatus Polarisedimenticolaceae bacterium]|nr:hypothetical protein [Candidatus Polarisedimenticolaceae bacterium]
MRYVLAMLVLLAATAAPAATPPALINYQGVLRDAADRPLSGSFDMVFTFYDAASAGNQILVDTHAAANAVPAMNGLFTVQLGGGVVTDGTGAGGYTALDQMFRDFSAIFVEIKVGAETLSPRTRVVSAAYALSAGQLNGQPSGFYLDTSPTWQTKAGAIRLESSDTGHAALDAIHLGTTPTAAGYFEDNAFSGRAWLAQGNTGASAYGTDLGGYFADTDQFSYAYAAYGDYGLKAAGPYWGGHFVAWGSSSSTGIYAEAPYDAGYFYNTGWNQISIVGARGGVGLECYSGASSAYVCLTEYGIAGHGNTAGGYFASVPATGEAYLGYGDEGVHGYGAFGGGYFDDLNSSSWVRTGYSTYKVQGSGSVSFVQNHPYDKGKVIVYAAPEGDEVAVYTRGSARLKNGEARVALGDTFALVANPDVGLTVHVTPTGEPVPLAVAEKGTSEIVVRGPAGSDASFDYIVWGLRIGFEQQSIVQPKRTESPIPAMTDHQQMYAADASLKQFDALERYKSMRGPEEKALDLSKSQQLMDAIGVYDPQRDGSVETLHGLVKPNMPAEVQEVAPRETTPTSSTPPSTPPASAPPRTPAPTTTRAASIEKPPAAPWIHALPASGAIEIGDVVALDPEHPGQLRRAAQPSDPDVVGIAVSPSANEQVEVAAMIVAVRVDAGYGPIAPGDLLTSSPTAGAAMRAIEPTARIIGKALEPLEVGTGTIRVLLGSAR